MPKLVVIVTATAALLLAGGLASNAQTSRGAANIHAQAQNFTPIEKAACGPHLAHGAVHTIIGSAPMAAAGAPTVNCDRTVLS